MSKLKSWTTPTKQFPELCSSRYPKYTRCAEREAKSKERFPARPCEAIVESIFGGASSAKKISAMSLHLWCIISSATLEISSVFYEAAATKTSVSIERQAAINFGMLFDLGAQTG